MMVYRWDAVQGALWNLAQVSDGSPFDGHMMRYANPLTGGWALQTMGAHMQMLKPGFHGQAHRHPGNVVSNVAGGSGYSIIGGARFVWQTTDVLCVHAGMVPEQFHYTPVGVSRSEDRRLRVG